MAFNIHGGSWNRSWRLSRAPCTILCIPTQIQVPLNPMWLIPRLHKTAGVISQKHNMISLNMWWWHKSQDHNCQHMIILLKSLLQQHVPYLISISAYSVMCAGCWQIQYLIELVQMLIKKRRWTAGTGACLHDVPNYAPSFLFKAWYFQHGDTVVTWFLEAEFLIIAEDGILL